MSNKTKGSILIVVGFLLVFVGAIEFIIRLAIFLFGFYLIYRGFQLRNDSRFTIFIHKVAYRTKDKLDFLFPDFF